MGKPAGTVIPTFRASSDPLAMICAGSAYPGRRKIRTYSEGAEAGQLIHRLLEQYMASDGRFTLPATMSKDISVMYWTAVGFLKRARDSLPNILTEARCRYETPTTRHTGHIDLISRTGDPSFPSKLTVIDYKSNLSDTVRPEPQLMRYLLLAHHRWPTATEFQWVLLSLRKNEVTNSEIMDLPALKDYETTFYERVVKWDHQTYTAGEHCKWCQRQMDCTARRRWIRATVGALVSRAPAAPVTPARLIEAFQQLRAVEAAVPVWREAIKAALAEYGSGGIEVDGALLEMVERPYPNLDTPSALEFLRSEMFSEEELWSAASLHLAPLVEIVRGLAPRGQKGAHAKVLKQRLIDAGALTYKTSKYPRLTLRTKEVTGHGKTAAIEG